jgi:TrmH family RNA methyltransferase
MISIAQAKLIRSLRQKKFRDQHHLYLVEGEKMVNELLALGPTSDHKIKNIFATSEWIRDHQSLTGWLNDRIHEATPRELKKVSNLVTPQPVMAITQKPSTNFDITQLKGRPVLAFESIRDPGNLGTIMRTADWFGIDYLICSPDSADPYNPKVVQASMGAIFRVGIQQMDLLHLINSPELQNKTIYGTFLDGERVYGIALEPDALILFGNESQGLSSQFNPLISKRISIPSFSREGSGSESLNVASSVAVICSELRRG